MLDGVWANTDAAAAACSGLNGNEEASGYIEAAQSAQWVGGSRKKTGQ